MNPNNSEAEKAAVRQLATELLQRARNGEDFTALVKQYSDGPGAANGGYLGRFRRGSLNAAMEDVLFVLEPGKFGGPFETTYGVHVVRVIGRHSVEPEPFASVRGKLRQELHQRLMAKEFNRWIADPSQAFIELALISVVPFGRFSTAQTMVVWSNGYKQRILIADDEENIRRMLELHLVRDGFEVQCPWRSRLKMTAQQFDAAMTWSCLKWTAWNC